MRHRVLIVDDDEHFARPLQRTLEIAGFEVLHAPSAEGVTELLRSARVDIVLTDRRLPGIDGLELVRRLKSATPTLPVVVMTGGLADDALAETLRLGAEGCLFKPFDSDLLLATVNRLVRAEPPDHDRSGPSQPRRDR